MWTENFFYEHCTEKDMKGSHYHLILDIVLAFALANREMIRKTHPGQNSKRRLLEYKSPLLEPTCSATGHSETRIYLTLSIYSQHQK
jgi:hypothetical protein